MGLSTRWTLCAALGLSLAAYACGDSADSKSDESNGGEDKGDASGITIGEKDAGGDNNGGNNEPPECTGQGQQCACSGGGTGIQTCTDGKLGECTCIDLSDAGLPPPSDCLAGATCQNTMGFIKGVAGFCTAVSDGGAAPAGPAIPPSCATKADCEAEGLPGAGCVMLNLPVIGPQQLCVQPCTPM